jgi:hypothetical protein
MKTLNCVAGIDVHKSMLAVVVGVAEQPQKSWERRKFGTSVEELRHVVAWLQERGVLEVVMESTAMYWRPVWIALEPHVRLELAQAQSNRAPHAPQDGLWRCGEAGASILGWGTAAELRPGRGTTALADVVPGDAADRGRAHASAESD